jgi:hypothetical protein
MERCTVTILVASAVEAAIRLFLTVNLLSLLRQSLRIRQRWLAHGILPVPIAHEFIIQRLPAMAKRL